MQPARGGLQFLAECIGRLEQGVLLRGRQTQEQATFSMSGEHQRVNREEAYSSRFQSKVVCGVCVLGAGWGVTLLVGSV